MSASTLARAGYAPFKRAYSAEGNRAPVSSPDSSAAEYPPNHPLYTAPCYSHERIPDKKEVTPQAIVRHATLDTDVLDRAARSAESIALASVTPTHMNGSSGQTIRGAHSNTNHSLESELGDRLIAAIDQHAEMMDIWREAEETAARGAQVNMSALLARSMAVGTRILNQRDGHESIGAILRSHVVKAIECLRGSEAVYGCVSHPPVWESELMRLGVADSHLAIDRMISHTTEDMILAIQNEAIVKSNARHQREAERKAKDAEREAEIERERIERIERIAKEAELRRQRSDEKQHHARELKRIATIETNGVDVEAGVIDSDACLLDPHPPHDTPAESHDAEAHTATTAAAATTQETHKADEHATHDGNEPAKRKRRRRAITDEDEEQDDTEPVGDADQSSSAGDASDSHANPAPSVVDSVSNAASISLDSTLPSDASPLPSTASAASQAAAAEPGHSNRRQTRSSKRHKQE